MILLACDCRPRDQPRISSWHSGELPSPSTGPDDRFFASARAMDLRFFTMSPRIIGAIVAESSPRNAVSCTVIYPAYHRKTCTRYRASTIHRYPVANPSGMGMIGTAIVRCSLLMKRGRGSESTCVFHADVKDDDAGGLVTE